MVVRTFFGKSAIPVWVLSMLLLWAILASPGTGERMDSIDALTVLVSSVVASVLLAFLLFLPLFLALIWLMMKVVSVPNCALWGVRWCIWETQAAEADVRKGIARRTRRIYLMPYHRWLKIDQRKWVYAPKPNTKRMTGREYVVVETRSGGTTHVTYVFIPRWKPRFWASRIRDNPTGMSKRGRSRPYVDKAIKIAETRSKTQ